MPSVFDPVELEWQGEKIVIPPNRVLGAVARIEEQVSVAELHKMALTNRANYSKLAAAFGSVLRYGATPGGPASKVTDDEVYASMFAGAGPDAMMEALTILLNIVLPPERSRGGGAPAPEGKPQPTASASSKSSTPSRPGKDGSRRRSSGT